MMLIRTESASVSEGESPRYVRCPCGTDRSEMMADSASIIAKMRNEDRGNVRWAGICEDVSPLLQGGRRPWNEGGGTRPLPK